MCGLQVGAWFVWQTHIETKSTVKIVDQVISKSQACIAWFFSVTWRQEWTVNSDINLQMHDWDTIWVHNLLSLLCWRSWLLATWHRYLESSLVWLSTQVVGILRKAGIVISELGLSNLGLLLRTQQADGAEVFWWAHNTVQRHAAPIDRQSTVFQGTVFQYTWKWGIVNLAALGAHRALIQSLWTALISTIFMSDQVMMAKGTIQYKYSLPLFCTDVMGHDLWSLAAMITSQPFI